MSVWIRLALVMDARAASTVFLFQDNPPAIPSRSRWSLLEPLKCPISMEKPATTARPIINIFFLRTSLSKILVDSPPNLILPSAMHGWEALS